MAPAAASPPAGLCATREALTIRRYAAANPPFLPPSLRPYVPPFLPFRGLVEWIIVLGWTPRRTRRRSRRITAFVRRCLNAAGTRAIRSIHNQRTFRAAADAARARRKSPPLSREEGCEYREYGGFFALGLKRETAAAEKSRRLSGRRHESLPLSCLQGEMEVRSTGKDPITSIYGSIVNKIR